MEIALIGGGRWSRVIATCLQKLSTPPSVIHWFTQHGMSQCRAIAHEKQWSNINFAADMSIMPHESLDAVIIATAPHTHIRYATPYIDAGIPTLIEKPLALCAQEAHDLMVLAKARQCHVGVNVEFVYASYLADFKRDISTLHPKHVAIDWIDPAFEERYGEIKMGQFYTPMIHDIFPHIWSLVKTLWPESPLASISSVRYAPNTAITIEANTKKFATTITLWRRGPKRVRRITINENMATLDFSTEPGHSQVNGHQQDYAWTGDRPLNLALQHFINMINTPTTPQNWALAVDQHLPSVKLAQSAHDQLREQQDALINTKARNKPDHNEQTDAWLIDRYLPDLTRQGTRLAAQSPKDLVQCAEYIRKHCLP